MQESDTHWLRTDTMTEAVKSLEHAVRLLEASRVDSYQLKWAIHALQQSAQNFMLATFDRSDRAALDEKWWDEWQLGFDGEAPYPEEEPRTKFRHIYRQFKKRNAPYAEIAQTIGVDFHRGIGLRDGFEHMPPKGWSIEARLLRQTAAATLRLIRFVSCERKVGYPAIQWAGDEEQRYVVSLLKQGEAAAA